MFSSLVKIELDTPSREMAFHVAIFERFVREGTLIYALGDAVADNLDEQFQDLPALKPQTLARGKRGGYAGRHGGAAPRMLRPYPSGKNLFSALALQWDQAKNSPVALRVVSGAQMTFGTKRWVGAYAAFHNREGRLDFFRTGAMKADVQERTIFELRERTADMMSRAGLPADWVREVRG